MRISIYYEGTSQIRRNVGEIYLRFIRMRIFNKIAACIVESGDNEDEVVDLPDP
jgi:hypothetical protein